MHKKNWFYALNYFFFFGAFSIIFPFYIPMIYEYTESDEAQIGYLFTLIPIVSFIGKPIFCFIADKYFIHKRLLQTFMLLNFISFLLYLILPYANFSRITNWYLFSLFSVAGYLFLCVSISLIDTLTIVYAKKYNQSFGILRLFSSLGWGCFCAVIGYIGSKITFLPPIVPNIIAYGIIMIIDIIIITIFLESEITPEKNNDVDKKSTFKQVVKVYLEYPSIMQYLFITIICGLTNGVIWTFYSLFIETLTENSLQLIGLGNFMPCLLSEIPIFLISDKIIKFCGLSNSFNIALIALFIRFMGYAFIVKPERVYIVLLVDLTQGFTFGLFYSAMINTANYFASKAKKSENEVSAIETTMQGIFCGCFEGLGAALGSFIGGLMIKNFGIINNWIVFGIISLSTLVFNISIDCCKNCYKKKSIIFKLRD